MKWWITINEPLEVVSGYSEKRYAPFLDLYGIGDYLAGHTLLRAHAKAYRLYDNEFRAKQNGKLAVSFKHLQNQVYLTDGSQRPDWLP